jgi:hypothetical protein
MTGQLDEVSRLLGAQGATLEGLKEVFDRHCDDDDRRHSENIEAIHSIGDKLEVLHRDLQPLAESVKVMRPVVDAYQATRARIAAWASIGLGIIVVLGWAFDAAIRWAVTWALSHFHWS